MNTLPPRLIKYGVAGGLALSLLGCTPFEKPDSASGSPEASAAAPSLTETPVANARIEFTSLGGGSPIILSYRGSGESAYDRAETGRTYKDGQPDTIDCQVEGREVAIDPAATEKPQTDDPNLWYALEVGKEYMPAMYMQRQPDKTGHMPELPNCETIPAHNDRPQ